MKRVLILTASGVLMAALGGIAAGGSIDSFGAPSTGSGMYTLSQIYDYLTAGTAAAPPGALGEPGSGPTNGTMNTLKEVYEAMATPFPQCNATSADVLPGKTFFSTHPGNWGVRTGAIAEQSLNSGATVQSAGYYSAFDLASTDPDLATSNIRSGVSIYGVSGNPNVVNTGSGTAAAGDIKGGAKAWVSGTELTGTMPNNQWTATASQIKSGAMAGGSGCTTITGTMPNSEWTAGPGDIKSGAKAGGSDCGTITGTLALTGNAGAGDVKSGKTFYSNSWTLTTGTMNALNLDKLTMTQAYGYDYNTNMTVRSSGSFTNNTTAVILEACSKGGQGGIEGDTELWVDGVKELSYSAWGYNVGCSSKAKSYSVGTHNYQVKGMTYNSGQWTGSLGIIMYENP